MSIRYRIISYGDFHATYYTHDEDQAITLRSMLLARGNVKAVLIEKLAWESLTAS